MFIKMFYLISIEEWTLPRPFFDHFRLDMIGNLYEGYKRAEMVQGSQLI